MIQGTGTDQLTRAFMAFAEDVQPDALFRLRKSIAAVAIHARDEDERMLALEFLIVIDIAILDTAHVPPVALRYFN